jgi:hypothetical protein
MVSEKQLEANHQNAFQSIGAWIENAIEAISGARRRA